ncbi:threonine transporter RhtB [Anopheles sinensis]|uniref:Threonine transporter RhtB n=1 Tax=Anopheles sinensis TaxID=74873 RepID=A0A084VGJ3_ANOSI|nr:threonine transporter RhtB [Anopheles sinensis]
MGPYATAGPHKSAPHSDATSPDVFFYALFFVGRGGCKGRCKGVFTPPSTASSRSISSPFHDISGNDRAQTPFRAGGVANSRWEGVEMLPQTKHKTSLSRP